MGALAMSAPVPISASVLYLVNAWHRSGDIRVHLESRGSPALGSALHRRLQRAAGDRYAHEVPLSRTWIANGYAITLRGRADSVQRRRKVAVLEEIKTTRADLDRAAEYNHPQNHAQAMLYAAMLAARDELDAVELTLRYVHQEDGRERVRRWSASRIELETFAGEAIRRFAGALAARQRWRMARDASIERAGAPHAGLRAVQRDLARSCLRVQRGGGVLTVEAPTGSGKTLGVLYPAMFGLARGQFERVVFLTARGTGAAAARAALGTLEDCGMRVKAVGIEARARLCFNPGLPCDADHCQYARGYYDKRQAALVELLAGARGDRDALIATAARHTVCPFELSLDAIWWCDVVIGDYNYVFDPNVRLQRLVAEARRTHLLIDEAHQLPTRVREALSAGLDESLIRAARRHAAPPTGAALDALEAWMLAAGAAMGEGGEVLCRSRTVFAKVLERVIESAGREIARDGQGCRTFARSVLRSTTLRAAHGGY